MLEASAQPFREGQGPREQWLSTCADGSQAGLVRTGQAVTKAPTIIRHRECRMSALVARLPSQPETEPYKGVILMGDKGGKKDKKKVQDQKKEKQKIKDKKKKDKDPKRLP